MLHHMVLFTKWRQTGCLCLNWEVCWSRHGGDTVEICTDISVNTWWTCWGCGPSGFSIHVIHLWTKLYCFLKFCILETSGFIRFCLVKEIHNKYTLSCLFVYNIGFCEMYINVWTAYLSYSAVFFNQNALHLSHEVKCTFSIMYCFMGLGSCYFAVVYACLILVVWFFSYVLFLIGASAVSYSKLYTLQDGLLKDVGMKASVV